MTIISTENKGMKKNMAKQIVLVALSLLVFQSSSMAGNEERAGEAGAPELLINPWARSIGFAGANSAVVTGLEAVNLNVAGLAFTPKTELIFSNTAWLKGTGIKINSAGLAQRLGEASVLGISIMAMDFGDIDFTQTDQPAGGLGTYNLQYLNLGISYAKSFSNSIYGGITFKIISQSTSNLSANSMAVDAGVKYQTGKMDRVKFGISIRNVGPPITFEGDGIDVQGALVDEEQRTLSQRTARAELPSLVNIGFGYDFFLSPVDTASSGPSHILTAAGNFTSNSFTKDQYRLGLEYTFNTEKAAFKLRAGHIIEKDIFDENLSTNAQTGLTAGVSIEAKFGGSIVGIDYGFQNSTVFEGFHTIGLRITL